MKYRKKIEYGSFMNDAEGFSLQQHGGVLQSTEENPKSDSVSSLVHKGSLQFPQISKKSKHNFCSLDHFHTTEEDHK